MAKKLIRLTESDLHKIVKECIGNILIKESQLRCLLRENEGSETIEPTVSWVKSKYNEFNNKYFDGFLPKCSISVKPLGESCGHVKAGTFRFMNSKGSILYGGANVYYDSRNDRYEQINRDTIYRLLKPVITINSKYSAPPEQIENTIIHEMCHYYTFFNKDGSLRVADRENDMHGDDFMKAAEMVSEKSGGKIKINALLSSEDIKQYQASSYFEKGGFKICLAEYNGIEIFWYTKYPSIWIKFAFPMLKTDVINVTQDSNVLMLLKRYRYNQTTYTNKNLQVYGLDKAPQELVDAFGKARFEKVTRQNYDEIFGDD